ncbi:multiple epidermal growth factor-like domains protein 9 isoform X2 [Esox lucius]|uniref:Si:ch211-158d24.2 n=1 Tax=Esox lucius TaxID=8010 RepID=A0A3P8X7Q3_ESOLU|nr:multiple epidermal growth factor-like domains protein 9 isoform X2 [Esox lucius]
MRLTTLMMYISSALLFVLYIGFSDAAPRVNSYDASPIARKPRSASASMEPLSTTLPNRLPEDSFVIGPLTGLTPSPTMGFTRATRKTIPVSKIAVSPTTTTQPPTADPTFQRPNIKIISREQITALSSRTSNSSKRSTDAQTSVFPPEKRLQTMVSMVSQRTTNDAWSLDNIHASISSSENSQEPLCNCSSEGVLDVDDCDKKTGQCVCMPGYAGLLCEDCEEGHFTNGTTGCMPCGCDSYGAVNHLCDSSGTCACKTGVYGPKCDECHPGFFRFSSTGCQPCQCNDLTNYCHPQSGICLNCQGNTQGPNCEECKPRFYRSSGAATTDACVACPCLNTSSTGTCHTDSEGFPVCDQCLSAYSGPLCDQCQAGFYSARGACVSCDCSGNADPMGPAQLCNPHTGQCLSCSFNTTGPQCQVCAPGFTGDARAHNCTSPEARIIPNLEATITTGAPKTDVTPLASTPGTKSLSSTIPASATASTTKSSASVSVTTTQALLTSLGSPTENTTAALTEVSWTQFNIIVLAVIILVVLLLLGFVGGVYTYREYQNRKLNAPFWTIELKEDNISFSSYHDSIPNADVSGLLEDEANEPAPNGQLALTTQGNCYKA